MTPDNAASPPPNAFQTLRRLFDALPGGALDTTVTGVCQIRIEGPLGTQCHIAIESGGRFRLHEGTHDWPDATVAMGEAGWVELSMRERDPRILVGQGKLDASGNIFLVQEIFRCVFAINGDRDLRLLQAIERRVKQQPQLTTVERLATPAQQVLDETERLHRPLVVTGAIDHWKAAGWTFDLLRAAYPDVTLAVNGRRTPMRTFIDEVLASSPDANAPYAGGTALAPELEMDLGELPYFQDTYRKSPYAWMGAAGHVSSMHRDVVDGMLVQCVGRKRIILFSPDQTEYLYAETRLTSGVQNCRVDPTRPDLAQYPLFAKAQPIELLLQPGELLFLPGGWYHWIQALDHAVSLKFFQSGAAFRARIDELLAS